MNSWRKLTKAIVYRAWIQQKVTTVIIALIIGCTLALFCTIGAAVTNTNQIPADMLGMADGIVSLYSSQGELLSLNSFIIMQMPIMIALFVAIIATLILPGVVTDDIEGGGLEALLASGTPRQRLFAAYLGAGVILTLAGLVSLLLGFIATFFIAVAIMGMSLSANASLWLGATILPLATSLWAASATLTGALLYPSGLESKNGMNGGWVRLVAIVPVMFIAAPLAIYGAQYSWLYPVAIIVSLLLAWSAVRVASKGFRTAKILRS